MADIRICLWMVFLLLVWTSGVLANSSNLTSVKSPLDMLDVKSPLDNLGRFKSSGPSSICNGVMCTFPSVRWRFKRQAKVNKDIISFSAAERDAILNFHNQLRQSVQPPASNMLTMKWDDELETLATNWAAGCAYIYNPNTTTPSYTSAGENVFAGIGGYNETSAVQSWFDEYTNYDYSTNTCNDLCGHYTQVVWAVTDKIGCGIRFCQPLFNVAWGANGAYFIVCNYAPPGNYPGQRPYELQAVTTTTISATTVQSSTTTKATTLLTTMTKPTTITSTTTPTSTTTTSTTKQTTTTPSSTTTPTTTLTSTNKPTTAPTSTTTPTSTNKPTTTTPTTATTPTTIPTSTTKTTTPTSATKPTATTPTITTTLSMTTKLTTDTSTATPTPTTPTTSTSSKTTITVTSILPDRSTTTVSPTVRVNHCARLSGSAQELTVISFILLAILL